MNWSFIVTGFLTLMITCGTLPEVYAGSTRDERERREDAKRDAARRRAKRKKLEVDAAQEAKYKAASARKAEAEEKIRKSRLASVAQQLKAEQASKTDFVIKPRGLQETEATWTGKLTKESITIGGKPESVYVLTTADGKRVLFSKKSIIDHSVAGMDFSLYVGKEMTVMGFASARKKGSKVSHYVVSRINSSTLKSSAIYDDLAE